MSETDREIVNALDKAAKHIRAQSYEIERLQSQLRARSESCSAQVTLLNNFVTRLKNSIKENIDRAWHADGNGIYEADYVLTDIDRILEEMGFGNGS